MPSFDKKKLVLSTPQKEAGSFPFEWSIQVSIAMDVGPMRGLEDVIRMASQKGTSSLFRRPVVGPI